MLIHLILQLSLNLDGVCLNLQVLLSYDAFFETPYCFVKMYFWTFIFMTACLFRCKQLQIELEQRGINATSSIAAVVDKISDDAADDELLRSWWMTQKKNLDLPKNCRRFPPSVIR